MAQAANVSVEEESIAAALRNADVDLEQETTRLLCRLGIPDIREHDFARTRNELVAAVVQTYRDK